MARRARRDVNLLRLAELLQAHITPALCQAAFGRVRRTERQRAWTLTTLVQFWVAVILRAPKALSQALADGLEQRDPLFPRVPATPEAFFQRSRAPCSQRGRSVPRASDSFSTAAIGDSHVSG